MTIPPRRGPSDLARLPIGMPNLRAVSLAEGLRAALSVAAIIAASEVLNLPLLREAGLAALLTCICDPGGPIGRRVPVLLGFTFGGAVLISGLGLIRGLGPPIALPIGLLAVFLASFASIYGLAIGQLGRLLIVVIILSLDQPIGLPQAIAAAGAFAAGGVWATLLTLVIWRVHPFLPARRAVAEAYRVLAAQVEQLRRLLRTGGTDEAVWETHARLHRRAVREAIEAARTTVMDTLRARGAGSHRAVHSVIRLESADQVFGALIALSDLLEHGSTIQRDTAARLLRRLAPVLVLLGRVAVTDEPDTHTRIRRSLDAMEGDVAALPPDDPLRGVAGRIIERLRMVCTLAVPANFLPGADAMSGGLPWRERIAGPLRANLDWRSLVLRHALRATAVAAPPLALTMAWFSPYEHWLTITAVATVQPYFALTYARAIERVAGTAAGGVVAAAVGVVCVTPLSMAVAMFPLSIVALALRGVNFGLFMMAMTPLVVLLVETGQPGASEWIIALARAGFTALGGVVAVAASFALWPVREPERLVAEVRSAIGAHARYADAVLGQLPADPVIGARRAAGLSSNSLEGAITRSLLDPAAVAPSGDGRDRLEAALVIDAALRRFAGRVAAMRYVGGGVPPEALAAWRAWITEAMKGLAEGETDVAPRPPIGGSEALLRVARQIELMAGAMKKVAG